MRHLLRCILLMIMVMGFSVSVCSAGMPRGDIAIGGVTVGTSLDYVEQIYGKPTASYYGEGDYMYGKTIIYNYNQMFVVYAASKGNQNRKIFSIICREKGLSTPGGLAVGMKFAIAKKIYGSPLSVNKNTTVNPVDGCRAYQYNSGSINMQFSVDKEGIIRQIVIYSGV